MATVIQTFSKRQKVLKGDTPDVFTYDSFPPALIVQIVRIWEVALGKESVHFAGSWMDNPAYSQLHKALATEFGLFRLGDGSGRDALVEFFVRAATADQVLDIIDLSFSYIANQQHDLAWKNIFHVTQSLEEAVSDLNARFLEHGLGQPLSQSAILSAARCCAMSLSVSLLPCEHWRFRQ